MRKALRGHWPEYLMEAAHLGLFMISACVFVTLLYHPASPVGPTFPLGRSLGDETLRRLLVGIAMASTAVAII